MDNLGELIKSLGIDSPMYIAVVYFFLKRFMTNEQTEMTTLTKRVDKLEACDDEQNKKLTSLSDYMIELRTRLAK